MFLDPFDMLIDDDFAAEWLSLRIEPTKEDAEGIAKTGNFIAATALPHDSEVAVIGDHDRRSGLFLASFDVSEQHIARWSVMRVLAIEDSVGIIIAIAGVDDDSIALGVDGERGGLLIARLEARYEVIDQLFLG